MAEGVAVVEDLAEVRLAQVCGHDPRLDLDLALDGLPEGGRRRVLDATGVGLDDLEDARVGDEAALDDLSEARGEVGRRQRDEVVEVAEDGRRGVEGPDEVLALRGVDPRLAPDGRVDHAEDRRGDVHDRHAPEPGRGHPAAEVRDAAAADGDDGIGAGEARLPHPGPQVRRDGDGLGGLGVGHRRDEDLETGGLERVDDRRGQAGEGFAVDDEHPDDTVREDVDDPRRHARPDEDVVVVTDGDRRHPTHASSSIRASAWARTASTSCPAVSTCQRARRS